MCAHFLTLIIAYIAEYTDRKKLVAVAVTQISLRANLLQDVFTLRSVSADGTSLCYQFSHNRLKYQPIRISVNRKIFSGCMLIKTDD